MATYKALRGPLAAIFVGSIAWTVFRKPVFMEASETAGGSPGMSQARAPTKVFSSGPAMVSLRLKSSENLNHNVKILRFEYPNPDATSGLSLTSSVLTMSWPKGGWFPVLRPYTPVSQLDEAGHLDLMVKRYPEGKASTYLHSLEPGQSLRFVAPLSGYTWTPNKHPHVALIAGGAGITPIYQLLQGIFQNSDDRTNVTLVIGANSDQDILLKDKLDSFKEQHPERLKVVYTVSNPVSNSLFKKGYITREVLLDVLNGTAKEGTKVFVCGPPAMEASLVGTRNWSGGKPGILEQLGYRRDQVHKF